MKATQTTKEWTLMIGDSLDFMYLYVKYNLYNTQYLKTKIFNNLILLQVNKNILIKQQYLHLHPL